MDEHSYAALPKVEETLAGYLSPTLAAWRKLALPFKPCRAISALVGKAYTAAGQAGASLHTMAVLQANQADLLRELDCGKVLSPDAVSELRRATDPALRATKQTAHAIGHSMAVLVATERHLWLNLLGIKNKDKSFLLDAPTSATGAMHSSNHIIKFTNDTTVGGLVSKNDKSAYREEVQRLTAWCKANNQSLKIVKSTKFLAEDLTWSMNTSSITKKAQQRLYFLRRLRKAHLPPLILTTFYRGTIESILRRCITAWFGNCTISDRKTLQRIVRTAEKII
ncbi:hypothetical protein QTP70_010462 [Hemibagrus guttatus]|uniref:Alkylated DNA repair protein AlkB homologue 8 N-terminal domain-containing protein n=1 Tax=Hemibagrus guttatus TaxID=175788 RepID=A0AAE0UYF5_9TELE|nr:hypothetical protein QTP70_010462 [Hemibagrus guttatus]KAK3555221.1 hypothetical protein QTP86_010455 [Hemibagrus guttatus]